MDDNQYFGFKWQYKAYSQGLIDWTKEWIARSMAHQDVASLPALRVE